ncbi:MAG TPA: hypothetical protein VGC97_16935 [Pyrinomonadaceae bacterium]|jgi:hypothetical protein
MYSTILIKFSIIRGGLFYRLQERLNLVNENDSRVVTRAVVFALVSWLPLLILATLQGLAINGDPHRSLLLDFPTYGRFLIAVPLFIIAENVVDDRYVIITSYFFDSGIISRSERSKYLDLLSAARRMVIFTPAEVVLVLIAYLISGLSTYYDWVYRAKSWQVIEAEQLSYAGWWYLLIGIPLFQFLFIRWVWRLIIWCIFLWRLSRLNLQLNSTHPDSVGGLGILGESVYAFAPIVFALSAVLVSNWGKRVLYEGAAVEHFHRLFLVFLLIMLLTAIAPLLFFTGRLVQLKLRGLYDYGVLADRHSSQFDEKWVRHGEKNIGAVLGTPDISSLADLGTGYQTVQKMKLFPFGLQNLAILTAAVFIPMIPLILIEIPLRELVKKIAGTLF